MRGGDEPVARKVLLILAVGVGARGIAVVAMARGHDTTDRRRASVELQAGHHTGKLREISRSGCAAPKVRVVRELAGEPAIDEGPWCPRRLRVKGELEGGR